MCLNIYFLTASLRGGNLQQILISKSRWIKIKKPAAEYAFLRCGLSNYADYVLVKP